jgi:hypothetical protein
MRLVPPPQHRLLRTRQAAEYLCMSEWKLRRLIQDGLLPYLHGGEGAPFLLDISLFKGRRCRSTESSATSSA